MTREKGEAGFTLAEMLVVLAILSLVAGASGLALSAGRTARELPRTVERLADDLRRTRIDAIRSGRMRSLAFDLPARVWRRETAEPVAIPKAVAIELTTAREASAGDGGASIAFLPNGRSTGGRIDLRTDAATRSLVVDWLTGAVREGRAMTAPPEENVPGESVSDEGFALAETLVAFAILALVMLAMVRAFAGTTATLRATAAGEARLELAERIVAERRAEPGLRPGSREGTEDGLAWISTVEPVDTEAPPQEGFPRLLRLVVAVGRSAGDAPQPVLTTLVLAAGENG